MDPKGIGMGLFAALLEVFLIYAYWPYFSGVCIVVKRPANATPASPSVQLFFGARLASSAFRSSITRLRSPGGIASTSSVRFGSFAGE